MIVIYHWPPLTEQQKRERLSPRITVIDLSYIWPAMFAVDILFEVMKLLEVPIYDPEWLGAFASELYV